MSNRQEILREIKKTGSLFKLAWKNIFSYAWINVKMILVFAFLAFLVCLFTVYNSALTERRRESMEESISANYVTYMGKMSDDCNEIVETYFEDAEYTVIKHYNFSERIVDAQGEMITNIMAKHISLEIDGKVLSTEDEVTNAATFGGEIFTKNDETELKRKFGYDSCIMGSMPKDSGQVVLSQPLINAFGLEVSEVVGKQVSLYLKGESLPFFVGTVSGAICKEFFSLEGHKNNLRVGILLHESDELFTGKGYSYRNLYALSDWLDMDAAVVVRENGFYYAGYLFINWIDTLDSLQAIANNLYYIIGSALIIGLILTICLMVGKYIRVFSRTGGILLTFGLQRQKLYGLLFLQLLILCMFAMPLAFALTMGGYYVINLLLIMIKNINMGVTFIRLIGMFGVGVGTIFVTAIIFFAFAVFKMRRQTVKQFLSTEVI